MALPATPRSGEPELPLLEGGDGLAGVLSLQPATHATSRIPLASAQLALLRLE
jgi:hypothetical protein